MFDPKKYDTRMRDPEDGRRKPSEAEVRRQGPQVARQDGSRRRRRTGSPISGALDAVVPSRLGCALLLGFASLLSAVAGLNDALHPFEGWEEHTPPPISIPSNGARHPGGVGSRREPPAWRSRLPHPAPGRVSGAVLLGTTRTVPHVSVRMITGNGRIRTQPSDEHGIFCFDDIDAEDALFEVRGAVDLGGRAPAARRLRTPSRENALTVDPRRALLLESRDPPGPVGPIPVTVLVAATNGARSGRGAWPQGRAEVLISGLEPDGFYDVLVQDPTAERSGLLERVAPGQEAIVALAPGVSVWGRVELPPGASREDVEVELTHGGLRIPARVLERGWQVDHLPPGSWWDVTARHLRPAGDPKAAQAGLHVGEGGTVVLDLR